MVDIVEKSPCADLLPLKGEGVSITEPPRRPMWTLSPYDGKKEAAAKALKRGAKVDWPAINGTDGEFPRAQWFGRSHILLVGAEPPNPVLKSAACVDQTDGWAVVDVQGAHARALLDRITPLDLRDASFPVGATARVELQHMQGAITRLGTDQYELMVFRSMAATLVHDLKTAMESVEALGQTA